MTHGRLCSAQLGTAYGIGMDIRTARLLLRPITLGDLDEYLAVYDDAEVVRFIGSIDRPSATRRLEAFTKQWEERGHGMFAVLDGYSRFVGVVGLDYWPHLDEIELGWVLRHDAWGQGFATEAAKACMSWGFNELRVPYITSMIRSANRRSIAVAERLGMSILRSDVLFQEPIDVYALTRDLWSFAASDVHPKR